MTAGGNYPSHHVQFLWLCWLEAHHGMQAVAVVRHAAGQPAVATWVEQAPADGEVLFARRPQIT